MCNFESASLCCGSTNEDTHSINWDSVEKALRATLPVDVVPPEGSVGLFLILSFLVPRCAQRSSIGG